MEAVDLCQVHSMARIQVIRNEMSVKCRKYFTAEAILTSRLFRRYPENKGAFKLCLLAAMCYTIGVK